MLDVSRSMDARDVSPSRLEATKLVLNQTLDPGSMTIANGAVAFADQG